MSKWIWQDYMITASIVLNMLARFATIFITTSVSTLATTSANLEANPIQFLLQFNYYLDFAVAALLYAVLIALYLYVRKINSPQGRFALNLITLTIFMLFLTDFVNDIAGVAAIIR